jgi:ferritin-like protein
MNEAIRRLMANSKKENKNLHFKCFEYRIYDIDIKPIVILGKCIKTIQRLSKSSKSRVQSLKVQGDTKEKCTDFQSEWL